MKIRLIYPNYVSRWHCERKIDHRSVHTTRDIRNRRECLKLFDYIFVLCLCKVYTFGFIEKHIVSVKSNLWHIRRIYTGNVVRRFEFYLQLHFVILQSDQWQRVRQISCEKQR
ncbi:hypothetical protein NY2A_b750R [Paramecium bursaria Chlorella virus NY2A]|uniref:Uncharacterized protein b750R n=1 Tax=Paramecium bursaria Chlorella virus NY2A TaxID=46021 RepID=A7IXS5_PBCVN|nr:hypothetical protein NY2A_b750R [Paramecium bursaria Chlorella virus NY2A]ABT15149.1 hypothetical protein NY2A_b750R [Paramecium bursaria Chlorella virus NY2A]